MDPRLSAENYKVLKFLYSFNFQKRLGYEENNSKDRSLSRKPRRYLVNKPLRAAGMSADNVRG